MNALRFRFWVAIERFAYVRKLAVLARCGDRVSPGFNQTRSLDYVERRAFRANEIWSAQNPLPAAARREL